MSAELFQKLRIIIPANEAKVGDDYWVYHPSGQWVKWFESDEIEKADPTFLWSREIEPWVSVLERLPEAEELVKILRGNQEQWGYLNNGKRRDIHGNLIEAPTHWLDTSQFPAPPKRDECEEAWDKHYKEHVLNKEGPSFTGAALFAIEYAYKSAWKAAMGMR